MKVKITRVEPIILTAPLAEPWQISTARMDTMYAVLVRIYTDAGVVGTGECLVRFAPTATAAVVAELESLLVGRDAMQIERIWQETYALMRSRGHSRGFYVEALSGIDIALWDIFGQIVNRPIHELLGNMGREQLSVYASSLLFKDTATLCHEAVRLVDAGFTAIKLKVGRGVQEDLAVVKAVRDAVGDGVELMVDANSAYRVADAAWLGRRLESLDIRWFEEPVSPDDLDGYRQLRTAQPIPLAAGESEFTPFGFRQLLSEPLLDIVQPDVARAGGFTSCRKIAALAEAANVTVAPHTGASGAVCIVAAAHLAAAAPTAGLFEYMYIEQPLQHIVRNPVVAKNGKIPVPQGPGLGIELDEKAVAQFRL